MLQELSSTSDTLPNPQILRLKQLLSGVAECVKGNGGLTLLGLFETLCTHPRLQVPNSGPWKWVLCEAATFPALPQLLGIPVLPSKGARELLEAAAGRCHSPHTSLGYFGPCWGGGWAGNASFPS